MHIGEDTCMSADAQKVIKKKKEEEASDLGAGVTDSCVVCWMSVGCWRLNLGSL